MLQLSDIVMSRASSIEQKVYIKSSLIGISHGLEDMVIEFKLKSEIFVSFQKFEFFMVEYDRYKILDSLCNKIYIFAKNINLDSVKDFKNAVFIELDVDDSMTDEWDIIINHPEHPAIFLSKEIFYTESPKEDQFRKFNGFLSFSSDILLESLKVIKSKLTHYGIYYNVPNINLKKRDQEVPTKKISFFLNRTLSEIEDKNSQLIIRNEEITSLYKDIKLSKIKIKHLAYHDYLTGLPNRLLLSEQINHAILLSSRKKKMLAIMFLDLDDFKMINDTMGHDIGDLLLVEVSKTLINTLRKCDTIARIGGDEFIILIEDIENMESINTILDKIIKCFNEPFILNNHDCFITTSIGVALYPTDGENAEALMKNADIAMYKAKERGKNKYIFCTPVMKTTVTETMKMTNSLYQAMERNELELYYQPQVNCTSNEIIGLEALIRWNHPQLGMVLPGKFIPIAEQTGLIIPIGDWVLRTACAQNKLWQSAGFYPIRIGVNLSAKQFQNDTLIKDVEDILRETGLECKYLEFEITESAVMRDRGHIAKILSTFKKMGIHIAIDDFGTEYSSLNYLKQLPIDRIKIPITFIKSIDVDPKDEAITKAIIILAKDMGLGVIAEGVETKSQLDIINKGMCDEIQGFYYFKPMPANEIERLFKNCK